MDRSRGALIALAPEVEVGASGMLGAVRCSVHALRGLLALLSAKPTGATL